MVRINPLGNLSWIALLPCYYTVSNYFITSAEFLYKQRIERDMRKAILEVRKNKLNNLRIAGKNKETINLNEDDE
ncbi:hypothetical protein [Bacillus sp. 491mf]|uniref:hypothetical protein n=1 Tax=Bacillus sp. 491mf TaxID=1761755 RepID=UPI00210CF6FA|nr:hypothetical protein [Bacillus sp. 491mf]